MADNLVIVESPAKAKTIEGFLGKDFIVKSSYGHVRDLAKNDKAIDIKNNFEPFYEISEEKKNVVSELTKLAKQATTVWLATDEDREGEAISWHLFEALGLKENTTKRIVFHEITKSAILEAIKNPRKIDKHLVDAQQARRILDRLVGFELSPILWKKIRPSLSAGRVQSVAVRIIVEREREISSFKSVSSYKVTANFLVTDENGKQSLLKAEFPTRFSNIKDAEDFLNNLKAAGYFISNLETKPGKKSSSAPFTTSTLQQEASRKLGFSVSQTMLLAQRLYEAGKITYMRTDSVNLSQTAIDAARKEILSSYGESYYQFRQYKTKSASAQEAHEAIRPTYFNHSTVDGDDRERKLYELIWKRTIASQMSDAQLEKTIATISNDKTAQNFIATGEVLKFDGFLKVYMESTDDETEDEKEGLLPPLTVGQKLDLREIIAMERFSYPPARYTEASLVKKLEELGIGRPSTYAPTISTIQKRNYVIKEERQGRERAYQVLTFKSNEIKNETRTEITGAEKGKLFPTDIGMVVNDFLVEYFSDVLDFNFTATIEKELDEIAEGKMVWQKMLSDFYNPFHKDVVNTEKNSERASGERILGKDPATGLTVLVRIGRYGPMVQLGTTEEIEKQKYAKLRNDQRLENITFEQAMDLFKMPRNLGNFEDKEVVIGIGRFGPYIRHDSKFISIPKTDDPYEIEMERAIELIHAKRKSEAEKLIKSFPENPEVQILKGRWGPYLVIEKNNYRLPKGKEPDSFTLEECLEIAKTTPARPGFKKGAAKKQAEFKKGPAEKKTPKKKAAKTAAKKTKASTSKKAKAGK